MQAGIFEYGNGTLAFNAGGSITATAEYLPNPYQITYNNIPVKSGVSVTSMTKTDWQGTYTLSTSSRTNLTTQSQTLTNGAWSTTQSTVSSVSNLAPDGVSTAFKIVDNSVSGVHFVSNTTALGAATYTISAFLKQGERRYGTITQGGGSAETAIFDLQNGAVSLKGANLSTASITAIGSGWYKCIVTYVHAGGAFFPGVGTANSSSTPSYSGDGVSGIYAWGVQTETGTSATAYIPTVGSTVSATDYSVTAGGVVTLGTNYYPGQYAWTGTGTQLPYCVTGPTNRYNRMAVGISGLAAETVSMYPSYDGQIWESNALRPIDLSTGAVFGSTTLANGTYRIHDTPWKGVLFMASAATSGAVRYGLLNAN